MDIKLLEDFLALAATGSFSRAAEDRNVTQPAFSRRIRQLEAWIGAELIDRSTYPMRLTRAGELLKDEAATVLDTLYGARAHIRAESRDGADTVIIAAMHSLAVAVLPQFLHRAGDVDGGNWAARTRIRSDNFHDCIQMLVGGNCDFALVYAHAEKPVLLDERWFEYVQFGGTPLVPVSAPTPSGAPAFTLPETAAGDVVPYLAYSADCYLGQVVETMLLRMPGSRRLRIDYEDTMSDALRALAIEGMGLSWLPERLIEEDLASGRLVRGGGPRAAIGLDIRLYRAKDQRSAAAEMLWSRAQAATAAAAPVRA